MFGISRSYGSLPSAPHQPLMHHYRVLVQDEVRHAKESMDLFRSRRLRRHSAHLPATSESRILASFLFIPSELYPDSAQALPASWPLASGLEHFRLWLTLLGTPLHHYEGNCHIQSNTSDCPIHEDLRWQPPPLRLVIYIPITTFVKNPFIYHALYGSLLVNWHSVVNKGCRLSPSAPVAVPEFTHTSHPVFGLCSLTILIF